MPAVASVARHAPFEYEWWARHAEATDRSDDKKWSRAMLKKMSRVAGQVVPVVVTSQFAGERLQHMRRDDARVRSDVFGLTLTMALFFSKRVGAKDLGPFNMMVDQSGRVLQVDMNQADESQTARFNGKGLQTSHKFDSRLWGRAKEYTVAERRTVADFLRRLVANVPLAQGVDCDLFSLDAIDAMERSAEDARAFVARW